MTDLLKTYIKNVLVVESAISIKKAISDGLALHRYDKLSSVEYILYDPDVAIQTIVGEDDIHALKKLPVLGYMSIYKRASNEDGPCYYARQVGASAAESGYGPLMYDIVMSDMGGFFVPDRDSVSTSASKLWKFYDELRPDVLVNDLDDINDPKTPPPHDDCKLFNDPAHPELDKAYKLRARINLNQLYSNDDMFVGSLLKLHFPDNEDVSAIESIIDDEIRRAGVMFFFSRFRTT